MSAEARKVPVDLKTLDHSNPHLVDAIAEDMNRAIHHLSEGVRTSLLQVFGKEHGAKLIDGETAEKKAEQIREVADTVSFGFEGDEKAKAFVQFLKDLKIEHAIDHVTYELKTSIDDIRGPIERLFHSGGHVPVSHPPATTSGDVGHTGDSAAHASGGGEPHPTEPTDSAHEGDAPHSDAHSEAAHHEGGHPAQTDAHHGNGHGSHNGHQGHDHSKYVDLPTRSFSRIKPEERTVYLGKSARGHFAARFLGQETPADKHDDHHKDAGHGHGAAHGKADHGHAAHGPDDKAHAGKGGHGDKADKDKAHAKDGHGKDAHAPKAAEAHGKGH